MLLLMGGESFLQRSIQLIDNFITRLYRLNIFA